MKNYELYFLQKLREFNNIEQQFVKYSYQLKKPNDLNESTEYFREAARLSFEAVELKNTILVEIHNVDELDLSDNEAIETLKKLEKNEGLKSTSFAGKVAELLDLDGDESWDLIETDLESYFSGDKYEKLWKDFYDWFFILEYYHRKAQVEAVVIFTRPPENIIKSFQELKTAFIFGLDKSSISLCRSILETALHDQLKKKGAFKQGYVATINLAKEDPLTRYITVSAKLELLNEEYKTLAHQIGKNANNIHNINDNENFSIRGLSLKTIADTVQIIEHLYRR